MAGLCLQPLSTCRSCVSVGKDSGNDFRHELYLRSEAEPAAEEDAEAEAEAEAGGVHGRNNCSQISDRGSEASVVGKVLQSLWL